MPDDLFALPRLASIYDDVEGARPDLDAYHSIVDELGAASVLDVGCGTGTFAIALALRGRSVTGADPAQASLDVARSKPGGELVTWVAAAATALPTLGADLAVMTGNVAQVFLTDAEWDGVVRSVSGALRPDGVWVFETRVPEARGWEAWTRAATTEVVGTRAEGPVRCWVEVVDVALPLVSFDQHYVFERDGAHLVSASTLRFRSLDEIGRSLAAGGFAVREVRGAPDRPGLEHVVIAQRTR